MPLLIGLCWIALSQAALADLDHDLAANGTWTGDFFGQQVTVHVVNGAVVSDGSSPGTSGYAHSSGGTQELTVQFDQAVYGGERGNCWFDRQGNNFSGSCERWPYAEGVNGPGHQQVDGLVWVNQEQ
jgi:hypothetical protein